MSGYKSTDIQYDGRGQLLLEIRNTVNSITEQMNALRRRLYDCVNKKNDLKKKLSKNISVDEIDKRGENLINVFNEVEQKQKDFENISKNTRGLSISKIEEMNRIGLDVLKRIKALKSEFEKFELQLKKLETVNKKMAELEDIILKINTFLKQNESLVRSWNSDKYEELINEKNELDNQIISWQKTSDFESIEKLVTQGRKYWTKVNTVVANCIEKDNTARNFIKQIENLIHKFEEKLELVKTGLISTKFKKYIAILENETKKILDKKLQSVDVLIKQTEEAIPALLKIDKNIHEAEKCLSDIQKIWQEKESKFQRWYPNEYDKLNDKIQNLVNDLEIFRRKLLNEDTIDVKKSIELYDYSKSIHLEINSFDEKINSNEELHQKRLYVVKALREICASLGLREKGPPHYLKANDIHSPIVQTFDTLNLGEIKFIVTLDGRLESDSGISTDKCGLEFNEISELLKKEFGMETEFRTIEESEPLKIEKSAINLPSTLNKKSGEK